MLQGVDAVLGVQKRQVVDPIARSVARNLLDLPVSPEATTGSMARAAVGLAPEEWEGQGVGAYIARPAGRAIEFAADILTDPLTWETMGLGGLVTKGAAGARAIALGKLTPEIADVLTSSGLTSTAVISPEAAGAALQIGRLTPEVAAGARRAIEVAKAVKPADIALRGAFAGTMAPAAVQEVVGAAHTLRDEGLSPKALEEMVGAGLSGYMAQHLVRGVYGDIRGERGRLIDQYKPGIEPEIVQRLPARLETGPEPLGLLGPAPPLTGPFEQPPSPLAPPAELAPPPGVAGFLGPAQAIQMPGVPRARRMPPVPAEPPPFVGAPEPLAPPEPAPPPLVRPITPEPTPGALEEQLRSVDQLVARGLPEAREAAAEQAAAEEAGRVEAARRAVEPPPGSGLAPEAVTLPAIRAVPPEAPPSLRPPGGIPPAEVPPERIPAVPPPTVTDAEAASALRSVVPTLEGKVIGTWKPRKGAKAAMGLDVPELEGVGDKKLAKAIKEDADNPVYVTALDTMKRSIADSKALEEQAEAYRARPPRRVTPEEIATAVARRRGTEIPPAPLAEGERAQMPPPTETQPVTPVTPRPSYAVAPAEPRAPVFFSQLRRVAERIPQTMSGNDLLRYLSDPKRGVKPAEMKWTGLDDFLRAKARVTPQEVRQFLDENEVRVEEKTLAVGLPTEQGGGTEAVRPKFAGYQLPGGENYRELLLKLPGKPTESLGRPGEYEIFKDGDFFARNDTKALAEENAAALRANPANAGISFEVRPSRQWTGLEREDFTGGHFEEPNVLAHIRMNDRTDGQGKRVLFIEEIQSDWAQKGRREGFDVDAQRRIALKQERKILLARGKPSERTGYILLSDPTDRTRLDAVEAELRQIGEVSGTPAAPFVTKTEDWTALAMKRVLRYAAEHGYDRVAWTTGEQQAARYDLSKHLRRIQYFDRANGEGYLIAYDLKGDPVIQQKLKAASELPDYIGKEAAERLLKRPPTPGKAWADDKLSANLYELSGLDLKVGGEGMRGFYDQIVPQVAEKIGKKWGARVATTDVGESPRNTPAGIVAHPLRVHSIDITPEMRRSVVGEGFPLFRGAEGETPVQAIDINAIKAAFGSSVRAKPIEDGFLVPLRTGEIRVLRTGEIEFDPKAFEAAYKRPLGETERVVGAFERLGQDGIVWLAREAPEGTLHHEVFHSAMQMLFTPKERAAVLRQYKTEEAAAEAYAKWGRPDSFWPNSFFGRIYNFFQRIYRAFRPTWESTFEQVRTGRAFERPVREPPAAPAAFAAAPIPSPAPEGRAPIRPIPPGVRPGPLPQPPFPSTEPREAGRATGQPPRVEENVEALRGAEAKVAAEERAAGKTPAPPAELARETQRTWHSLDPEIQEVLRTYGADQYTRAAQRGMNDSETQAFDAYLAGRRQRIADAEERLAGARGTANEAKAKREWLEEITNYIPLERTRLDDGTGHARALAARARIMEAFMSEDSQLLRRLWREAGTRLSDRDAAKILQMYKEGNPDLTPALRALLAGRWDKVIYLFRANLLSGIPTHMVNHAGDAIGQGFEVADHAAAAGVDWLLQKVSKEGGPRERTLNQVGAEISGMMGAAPAAAGNYIRAVGRLLRRVKTGEQEPIRADQPLARQVGPVGGVVGRLADVVLREMDAGDNIMWRPIAAAGSLHRLAFRQAERELGPRAIRKTLAERTASIVADSIQNPGDHAPLLREVAAEAERRVFQEKPWDFVQGLDGLARRHPWLNIPLPFRKTPANLVRYGLRHSPFGLLPGGDAWKAMSDYRAGRISRGAAADIIAPRLVGTIVFGALSAAAEMGHLTGSGPVNQNERRALLDTGWQPYSLVLPWGDGKVYIPMSRFDPASFALKVAGDLHELKDNTKEGELLSKVAGTLVQSVTSATYMQGLADATNAIARPNEFFAQYGSNLVGSVVPQIVNRAAIAIDPVLRDVRPDDSGLRGMPERAIKTLLSRIPGATYALPSRKTPVGEPAERAGNIVTRFFSPTQPSKTKEGTEAEALMVQIGYVPSAPSRTATIRGKKIRLSDAEYEQLSTARQAATVEVRRLMGRSDFMVLPDTAEEGGSRSKEAVIRSVYQRHLDRARQRLYHGVAFRNRLAEARVAT